MTDNLILKVLVGSQAHGLATPESDYDYRGVYVTPTREILSLNHKYKGTHWLEGEEDQTIYEINHFLQLALRCNPSILEVFKAPRITKTFAGVKEDVLGDELVKLFPYVWSPQLAFDAFVGYSLNQRKKMLDNHLSRWTKYATAYLRTLWNLIDLLKYKDFSLEVKDLSFKNDLLNIRANMWTTGEVVDRADMLVSVAREALKKCENKPNFEKVNDFLLKVRKEYFK